MTEQQVLDIMKKSREAVERGPGHIKVTYTYPLKLTKGNPGGHNQADCYRESVDALQVGVRTNNMKYAKDNFAATGKKVTECPYGFYYPPNKDEQGYFWRLKRDDSAYVRAKFENIPPEYKQVSRYFIDGVEVPYQKVVDAYNRGEFEKSAIYQVSERDLFDLHVAVDRVKGIKITKKSFEEPAREEFITEDYGWEIPTDRVWEFFERMKMEIGEDELLENIARALGDEKLADYLAYIARQFDMDYLFDENNSSMADMDFDDDYTGM